MGGRGASSSSAGKQAPSAPKSEGRGHVESVFTPSGVGMAEFIAKDLGVSLSKADGYVDAVFGWAMDGNWDIRAYQTGKPHLGVTLGAKEAERYANNLESFIADSPKWNAGTTYRGVNLSVDAAKQYKVGAVVGMGGLASWSSSESIGRYFTEPTGGARARSSSDSKRVVFVSPTQSRGTSINHLSPFGQTGERLPPQDEVLASSSSRYTVVKTERKGKYLYVYLDEQT